MTDVTTCPAIPVRQDDPWPECAPMPVLVGTGTLWVRDPVTDVDVDAGNFEAVSFLGEGEARRYFEPTEELQSMLAVTHQYGLTLRGDSFALRQLERLLNEDRISTSAADVIPLSTVREAHARQVTFTKTLQLDPCISPTCPDIQIILWRTYFDVPMSYEMNREEITEHTFNIVALPDPVNHPSQPFGQILLVCDQVVLS